MEKFLENEGNGHTGNQDLCIICEEDFEGEKSVKVTRGISTIVRCAEQKQDFN